MLGAFNFPLLLLTGSVRWNAPGQVVEAIMEEDRRENEARHAKEKEVKE